MFDYVKKQKVFEAAQFIVDFEKKLVDEAISKIEEHKDRFKSENYNRHVQWAFDNEALICRFEDTIADEHLQDLINKYNWRLSRYKDSKTFAGRMKFLL